MTKTERLARAKAYRDELNAKFRSYDGGDRPMSPPASFIRELSAAEQRVRDIEAETGEDASRPGLTEEQIETLIFALRQRPPFDGDGDLLRALRAMKPDARRASRGKSGPAATRTKRRARCEIDPECALDPGHRGICDMRAPSRGEAPPATAPIDVLGPPLAMLTLTPAPTQFARADGTIVAARAEGLGPEPGILAPAASDPSRAGHVSVPRAVLERLVDATLRDESVREPREAAERVLHLDSLRHEPARTDPEAARAAAKRAMLPSAPADPLDDLPEGERNRILDLAAEAHRKAFGFGDAASAAYADVIRSELAAYHAREPLCPDSHCEHPDHTVADEERGQ